MCHGGSPSAGPRASAFGAGRMSALGLGRMSALGGGRASVLGRQLGMPARVKAMEVDEEEEEVEEVEEEAAAPAAAPEHPFADQKVLSHCLSFLDQTSLLTAASPVSTAFFTAAATALAEQMLSSVGCAPLPSSACRPRAACDDEFGSRDEEEDEEPGPEPAYVRAKRASAQKSEVAK